MAQKKGQGTAALERLINSQHTDRAVDEMLTRARPAAMKTTRYRTALGEFMPDVRVSPDALQGKKRTRYKKFSYGVHAPIWARVPPPRRRAIVGPPAIADRPTDGPPRLVKGLT